MTGDIEDKYIFDERFLIKSGNPCSHKGCESHRSHPCEICGRIGMQGDIIITKFSSFLKKIRREAQDEGGK